MDWKDHYTLKMEFARQKREEKMQQRAFRGILRKHVSEEQWKAISDEWSNMNNKNNKPNNSKT